MTKKTIGQQEDEAAFQEMVDDYRRARAQHRPAITFAVNDDAMRFAWDAAIRRGIELRGCCQDSCASCRAVHHLHTEEP